MNLFEKGSGFKHGLRDFARDVSFSSVSAAIVGAILSFTLMISVYTMAEAGGVPVSDADKFLVGGGADMCESCICSVILFIRFLQFDGRGYVVWYVSKNYDFWYTGRGAERNCTTICMACRAARRTNVS